MTKSQRLFWVSYSGQPLRAVVTANKSSAGRLLRVSPYLLNRYGGVADTAQPSFESEALASVASLALAAPETVFVHTNDQWLSECSKAPSGQHLRGAAGKTGARRKVLTSYMSARVILLTTSEKHVIKERGGVKWLRSLLSDKHAQPVTPGPRRHGMELDQASFRLSDEQWAKYNELGGVYWLREQIKRPSLG